MPEVGIREGEKLHEIMVAAEASFTTHEYEKHFVIYPQMIWNEKRRGVQDRKRVPERFVYSSDNNPEWLSTDEIKELLKSVEHFLCDVLN